MCEETSKLISPLLCLPKEIVIQIIEQDCITLQDRMNLRLTCKLLESMVAESDYFSPPSEPTLSISLVPIFGSIPGSDARTTMIKGFIGETEYRRISIDRLDSFVYNIGRSFKRAHFDVIAIHNFNYKSIETNRHMNVDHLLQLSESFSCKSLDIRCCINDYDPRIFEVIAILNPQSELEVVFEDESGEEIIDDTLLLNLPSVTRLSFAASSQHFSISNTTLLALVNKHRFVRLEGNISLKPNIFLEIDKIISSQSHFLDFTPTFESLLACLRMLRVIWNGEMLECKDSKIKVVNADAYSYELSDPGIRWVNYKIETETTMMCIFKCSPESEMNLSKQFSEITIEKNEVNEIQSLIDLPNDIIIAIVEEESLSLEDRMNLRLTCKKMETIVAECEYNADSPLIIHKMPVGAERKYFTTINLLYDMMDDPTIPEGRHSSLIHLLSRLFRRVHCDCIQLNNFDFRADAPPNLMSIHQLLQLFQLFTCKDLRIDVSRPYYDARIFDVIEKLKPSEDLCLIAATSLNIDQELLRRLPPVPTLRFQTSKSSFFMISDETLLALISKHRFVSLGERAMNLQPETLIEAVKTIAGNGHMLLLTLRISLVVEMLQIIGVTYHGTSMTSSNPDVVIYRKATVINCFHSSVDSSDFAIDIFGTKITIYGVLTGVQQRDQELVVEIGLKN